MTDKPVKLQEEHRSMSADRSTKHPFSFPGNRAGFTDRNGNRVTEGDRVRYLIDGREGVLDEAMHDGDAFVTFDREQYETVKWNHLVKITASAKEEGDGRSS